MFFTVECVICVEFVTDVFYQQRIFLTFALSIKWFLCRLLFLKEIRFCVVSEMSSYQATVDVFEKIREDLDHEGHGNVFVFVIFGASVSNFVNIFNINCCNIF